LGVPAGHLGHAIGFLLEQLSYQTEKGVLNVSQKVYLEVADVAADWLDSQFVADANANLSFNSGQPKAVALQITDKTGLN
jgi:hypothetical protein